MGRIRGENHPWLTLSDDDMLRSAGLILKNPDTGDEGITLAGILLFGKESTIMSVLPHHKTDAIYRVKNLDRYDDRDAILREIISNILSHRDFSSGFVSKFIIEKDKIYTENSNRIHGFGRLELHSFHPYPKNPAISKVFREIGLADELGSGMRNTYKYTRMYSGGTPIFEEGDIFKTTIPISLSEVEKMGPGNSTDTPHDTPHDGRRQRLLQFCQIPRSRQEMLDYLELTDRMYFQRQILKPLLREGVIKMTLPDKPRSKNQKYVIADIK